MPKPDQQDESRESNRQEQVVHRARQAPNQQEERREYNCREQDAYRVHRIVAEPEQAQEIPRRQSDARTDRFFTATHFILLWHDE